MTENTQAKKLYTLLTKRNKTLFIAESCTGGLVSSLITDIPGSSDYFIGSVVAYSNDIKVRVLDVPRDLIRKKGAVSAEVAARMAEGARELFKTDISAAVTGIAGPSGGSAQKPVGLAYIAVASREKTVVKKVLFKGTRLALKKKFADAVLNLVCDCIGY